MTLKAFTRDGLEPGGLVLHPRSWVDILTNVDGSDVETGIEPTSASWRKGSHNKADESSLTLDLTAFNFPIRMIGAAMVTLYMGVVDEADDFVKKEANLRFYGPVIDYEPDSEQRIIVLQAQDLSYLCRRKTYPVRLTLVTDENGFVVRTIDPTPRYGDTLRKNIERLLSIIPEFQDPSVEAPLSLRDTDALRNADLSSLVSGRAKNAAIPLKPDSTVWEAIEHLCGLLGMHVKVSLREIVVRTSDEVFAGRQSKATFIFGGANSNAFGPKFHKKPAANRNGVRVNALNPETRKVVTAVWPDEAEQRQISKKQPKRTAVKSAKNANKKKKVPPPAAPRDVYELDPGHYTQDALTQKAKAIWLERSRQECDGDISTPVLTEEILSLENGNLMTLKVDADVADQVAKIGNDSDASQFLQEELGLDPDAADAMVRASRKPSQDDWYVKDIVIDIPSERSATVKFINLIEI